jgi:hypothetical protein
MAQQPFFTSHTPIARMDTRLAGSIGDRYAAGMQQAAQGFMMGMERQRAQKEKKEQEESCPVLAP